ncbi:hypothetical protein HK104_005416, partial [Borealophlyctis nickersoniae]
MKLNYEEQILQLRRELEARGGPIGASAMGQDLRQARAPAPPGPGFPDGVPPPILGGGTPISGSGAFGGLLQGGGGGGGVPSGPAEHGRSLQQPYMNGTQTPGSDGGPSLKRLRTDEGPVGVSRDMAGAGGPGNPYGAPLSRGEPVGRGEQPGGGFPGGSGPGGKGSQKLGDKRGLPEQDQYRQHMGHPPAGLGPQHPLAQIPPQQHL